VPRPDLEQPFAGMDCVEMVGVDPNGDEKDRQAQYDDSRAARRGVPTEFDRADGGTGRGKTDGCEQEHHEPAVPGRRLVGGDVVDRAGLL
jgi:hypothetical protein